MTKRVDGWHTPEAGLAPEADLVLVLVLWLPTLVATCVRVGSCLTRFVGGKPYRARLPNDGSSISGTTPKDITAGVGKRKNAEREDAYPLATSFPSLLQFGRELRQASRNLFGSFALESVGEAQKETERARRIFHNLHLDT